MGLVLSMISAAALMFTGCGGGSSSTPAADYNGKLVDSEVAGVSFECGGVTGVTAADGTFGTCPGGSTATFSIGGLTLGSSGVTGDGIFFITDIVGVARTATDNEEVLKIAVLLQSLDSDGDPSNGITVPEEAADTIDSFLTQDASIENISADQVVALTGAAVADLQATYPSMVYVPVEDAQANLDDSLGDILDGTITPPPVPTGSEGGS